MAISTVSSGDNILASKMNEVINQINTLSEYVKTIGEDIDGSTTPQAVCPINVANEIYDEQAAVSETQKLTSTTVQIASKFTCGPGETIISKAQLYTKRIGAPTGTVYVEIFAESGNAPTGSALASKGIDASTISNSVFGFVDFEFDEPLEVTENTDYCIVLRISGTFNTSNTVYYGLNDSADGYSYSTNSGSSWVTSQYYTYALTYKIYGLIKESKASKASAASTFKLNVIGFIHDDYSEDDSATIQIGKIQSGFSGLTDGAKYYLSDTAGEISLTPGTNEVPIGVAISTTELLIQI